MALAPWSPDAGCVIGPTPIHPDWTNLRRNSEGRDIGVAPFGPKRDENVQVSGPRMGGVITGSVSYDTR
jgi:hypothetical protein